MKLVKNLKDSQIFYPWGLQCDCGTLTFVASKCTVYSCEKQFPKDLTRQRDFLNKMCHL